MAKKTIFTEAEEILIAPWTESEGALTAPTASSAIELASVIADSLTITQEDPETTDIDCETSDEPIYSVTKAGKYTVELNNASIDDEYLEKVMGWEKDGNNFVAPMSYAARYIAIQVGFTENSKYLYLPKVLIAPKLVFESLSTNIAYGTLSGTASSAKVGSSSSAKEAPIAILSAAVLTKSAGGA